MYNYAWYLIMHANTVFIYVRSYSAWNCIYVLKCLYVEERAVEEGQNSKRPTKDFTIVIITLSIAGLIVITTIIIAFSALRYECKRSKLRRPNSIPQRYHNL